MGYYMSELYRRYFRATDFSELEEEIENTRQEVRDCLDQAQRRELMRLVDAQDQLKANLRDSCPDQRGGRENALWNPGAYQGQLYPGYLYPCDRGHAARRR